MQASEPREWAKPMNPRATGREAYGSWRGKGAVWNILNRSPGFHYHLADDSTVDSQLRKGHDLNIPGFVGYSIVDSAKGDKEQFVGYAAVQQRTGPTRGTQQYLAPFYLLKMPARDWWEIQKRASAERSAGLDVPTNMLISQNPVHRQHLERLGAAAGGRNYVPVRGEPYFKDADHGENGYGQEIMEVQR